MHLIERITGPLDRRRFVSSIRPVSCGRFSHPLYLDVDHLVIHGS